MQSYQIFKVEILTYELYRDESWGKSNNSMLFGYYKNMAENRVIHKEESLKSSKKSDFNNA